MNIASKDKSGENRAFNVNKNVSNLFSTSNDNIQPIKFVEKSTNKLQKQVINGDGISATVVAVPKYKNAKKKQDFWQILLDSGSDGDLLFVQKGSKKRIPWKERFAPQKWRTSNGTFKTTKVGVLELLFPEFSGSKLFSVRPDIVDIPANENKPVYDMILGVKTMSKMGVIFDFQTKSITIDQISLKMNFFLDSKSLNNLMIETLDPSAMYRTTNHAVEQKWSTTTVEYCVAQACLIFEERGKTSQTELHAN